MAEQPRRGVLLALAAEGIVPVLGGCAGALAGGPEGGVVGGVVGIAVGQAVEKVINFFGARIVERWAVWFRAQPPEVQQAALVELASLSAEEARRQAEELIDKLSLTPLGPADRAVGVDYLSLLPGALDRALPRDTAGVRSLPPTESLHEPQHLLPLLPVNLPPYPVGSEVPGTPYRLEALLGAGGFGAVYRASTRSLQHLPLAIKFCLDPGLALALHRERANLERLMKAGGESWSPRVVRLYGYDLEHRTPYLVYEYVTGGDLIRHLAERRSALGRALSPAEVYDLVLGVVEALAFAHAHGLVHRDLKPANVLVEGGVLKLADFGLGGLAAARAAQVSRIGATTIDLLSVADQASLFRGAGTPLYMAPEQKRGLPADPRHDLYSLGVMWYQLLVGDVSRELHPGWAKELTVRHGVPRGHINLIESCVGWFDERPKNAGELLEQMRGLRDEPAGPAVAQAAPALQPAAETAKPPAALTQLAQPADEMRQELLVSLVRDLKEQHDRRHELEQPSWALVGAGLGVSLGVFFLLTSLTRSTWGSFFLAVLAAVAVGLVLHLIRLGRLREAREKVLATVRTLTTQFPDIVQGWGGEIILRSRSQVEQLARRLGVVAAPAQGVSARSEAVVPADPEKRAELEALLKQAQEKCRAAASQPRPARFPVPVAVLLALALGGLVGPWLGLTFAGYLMPVEQTQWGPGMGPHLYHDALGQSMDAARYRLVSRWMFTGAMTTGFVSGIVAALLGLWLLLRRTWYRLALVGSLALGVAFGAPAGVGLGFLYNGFFAPYADHDGRQPRYYDFRGTSMTQEQYVRIARQSLTTSYLVAVVGGTLVALMVAWAFLRWYHRRAESALAEYEPLRRRLADEYPTLVAAHGGPTALDRCATLTAMLERVQGKSGGTA